MSADEEKAVRLEGRSAARQCWSNFEKVGDRLDELQRDYDDEEAREAFRQIEDLVADLDDALHEAQEVFRTDD